MNIRKIIREELTKRLKPKGIGCQKVAAGLILNNLPGEPRLDITSNKIIFKMIASSDGFGRKSHDSLEFEAGDIHNPDTDLVGLAVRVAKAIDKFLEFCKLSDNFKLETPTVNGSAAKGVVRRMIKKILPEEFFKTSTAEPAISEVARYAAVYENGDVKLRKGSEWVLSTPEEIADLVKRLAERK